jgi:hypothetical protein
MHLDVSDIRTLYSVHLLYMSCTPQGPQLHLDVPCTIQRPVLHLDVPCTIQRPVLHLDVPTIQRSELHRTCLDHRSLCCV